MNLQKLRCGVCLKYFDNLEEHLLKEHRVKWHKRKCFGTNEYKERNSLCRICINYIECGDKFAKLGNGYHKVSK